MSEEAIQDTGSQEVAEAAPANFLESLPEDLRSEPSLRNFADPASLAKSYVHAQRMIGADKVPLPGKSATPDEWRAVYQRLGAPDDANAYELNFESADFSENELSGLKAAALDAGLNNTQAQRIAAYLEETLTGARSGFDEAAEDLRHQGEQELRQEFGRAFLGGTEIFDEITLADGRMLGDHPQIVKMFAGLAEQIGEDSLEGAPTEMIMTPDEASRQIAEMTGRGGPYWDKMHPEHESYVQQVLTLREYL
jgi:hypothetical protein